MRLLGTGNLRKMWSNLLKKRKRLKNNHFNLNQGCKMMENRVTIQKKTIAGKSGLNPCEVQDTIRDY